MSVVLDFDLVKNLGILYNFWSELRDGLRQNECPDVLTIYFTAKDLDF